MLVITRGIAGFPSHPLGGGDHPGGSGPGGPKGLPGPCWERQDLPLEAGWGSSDWEKGGET